MKTSISATDARRRH